jgi:hypothetical protein
VNAKQHSKVSRALLGYSNLEVHRYLDQAAKWMGAGHRIVHHSPLILDMAEVMFGLEGRREALLHLLIDARIIDPVQVEEIVKAAKVR